MYTGSRSKIRSKIKILESSYTLTNFLAAYITKRCITSHRLKNFIVAWGQGSENVFGEVQKKMACPAGDSLTTVV